MNEKYLLNAEIITPVHVGAGQEKKLLKYIDFIINDRKLIIIDTMKVFSLLAETDRARFLNKLAGGEQINIRTYLERTGNPDIEDFRLAEIDCPGAKPENEVQPLISSAGPSGRTVYLPGSSIKGAIRSVLFDYFHEKSNRHDDKVVFGKIDINLMSYLQIGDAQFRNSRVINTKIFNLHRESGEWTAGWKHDRRGTDTEFKKSGFVTSYEVFNIKSKASFSLKINKTKLAYVSSSQLQDGGRKYLPPNHNFIENLGIPDLFKIINRHTKRYLAAEKEFFEHYNNEEPYCDDIIKSIDSLIKLIPEDNSKCLMNLGCGSGFHAITGDWQFKDDHVNTGSHANGKLRYKSRKMAFRKFKKTKDYNFMPMGFIMLSLAN